MQFKKQMPKIIELVFVLISVSVCAYAIDTKQYVCNEKSGYERTIEVLSSGGYNCIYRNQDGNHFSVYHDNPQRLRLFAMAIQKEIVTNPTIKAMPIKNQRLESAKIVLSKNGGDISKAQDLLDLLDESSYDSISESNAYINNDNVNTDVLSKQSIKDRNDVISSIEDDSKSGIPSTNSIKGIDSHTNYKATLPTILAGIITLNPEFFDSDEKGNFRLVNNIGELTLNPAFVKIYSEDHSQDSFVGKFATLISSLFSDNTDNVKTFKITDFMDKQMLGFLAYLTQSLMIGYNELLSYIFLSSVLISIFFYANNILRNGYKNKKFTPQIPLKQLSGMIVVFIFFLVPITKTGFITIKNKQEDHYTTLAQDLFIHSIQMGNYFANFTNDHLMTAYVALLNFKMGMIQDIMPRTLMEIKIGSAQIDSDKADLASKTDLYNTFCRPHLNNGTYNIPSATLKAQQNQEVIIKDPRVAFIGDSISKGIGTKVLASMKGSNHAVVGAKLSDLPTQNQIQQAIQSNPDIVFLQIGTNDIAVYQGGVEKTQFQKSYISRLQSIVNELRQGGVKKVVCSETLNSERQDIQKYIGSTRSAIQQGCDNVVKLPELSPQYRAGDKIHPTDAGYTKLANDVKNKITGLSFTADRIDSQGCKNLELKIGSETQVLTKKTTILNNKINNVKAFSDNIKGKSTFTTDPNKVPHSSRCIGNDCQTWRLSNNNGSFALPISTERPGYTYDGAISLYGVGEKGTKDTTATGEKMATLAQAGTLGVANWHLPLNSVMKISRKDGQSLYFRVTDRGPVVYYTTDEKGKRYRPVAPQSNPWRTSHRWADLPPVAYQKLGLCTDDVVHTELIGYNQPKGINYVPPNANPDGTLSLTVNRDSKGRVICQGGKTVTGEVAQGTVEPRTETIMIDNSPIRGLKDYIAMVEYLNNNFGWLSAISVPASYQFFKYINLYFVQNAEIDINGEDSIFSAQLKAQSENNHQSAIGEATSAINDTIANPMIDVIFQNSAWFVMPGFDSLFRATSSHLEGIVFRPQKDLSEDMIVNGSSILKAIGTGMVGFAVADMAGFMGGSDFIKKTTTMLAGVTVYMLGSTDTHLGAQLAIAILSMSIAIFTLSTMFAILGLLSLTTLVIIQVIFYFLEIVIFMLGVPFVVIHALLRGFKVSKVFSHFIKNLILLCVAPIILVIPIYLYIPTVELFEGLFRALGQIVFTLFDSGFDLISIGVHPIDSLKSMIIISVMSAITSLVAQIIAVMVELVVIVKFYSYVMHFIGLQTTNLFSLSFENITKNTKHFLAPL